MYALPRRRTIDVMRCEMAELGDPMKYDETRRNETRGE